MSSGIPQGGKGRLLLSGKHRYELLPHSTPSLQALAYLLEGTTLFSTS